MICRFCLDDLLAMISICSIADDMYVLLMFGILVQIRDGGDNSVPFLAFEQGMSTWAGPQSGIMFRAWRLSVVVRIARSAFRAAFSRVRAWHADEGRY